MDGIVLIDKPVGLTSRDICYQVGRRFNTKKVGHVGTLDPFASGLLIVAFNKATKAVTFFDEAIKTYEATLVLGEKKDSLDITGKTIDIKVAKEHTKEEIIEVLNTFLGDSEQLPPMTSAIKINGHKLYELARKGIEVERKKRRIRIYEISLLNFDSKNHTISFKARVSKGTYIRTLGEDIASKLGELGYLFSLRRIEVFPFDISKAEPIESAKVYSVTEILSKFIKTEIFDEKTVNDIKNGKIKYLSIKTKEDRILIIDSLSNPIAIYQRNKDDRLEFVRGLF